MDNKIEETKDEQTCYCVDFDLIVLSNQILLIFLKLFGLLNLSWIAVFSPLLAWFFILIVYIIFSLFFLKESDKTK